jgi:uncharacterized phage protein (TIGR01671 family)
MRENIGLYRGKRTDNKKWVEGYLFRDIDLEVCMIQGFNYYYDEDGLQREYFSVDVIPETVCECMEVSDINARLFFEGDIFIQSKSTGDDKIPRVIMRTDLEFKCPFIKEHWAWGRSCLDFAYLYKSDKGDLEIIGNVYDNPELMNDLKT